MHDKLIGQSAAMCDAAHVTRDQDAPSVTWNQQRYAVYKKPTVLICSEHYYDGFDITRLE